MMVPVVFLLLPLTVVFALFPGFYGLSLGSNYTSRRHTCPGPCSA